MQTLDRQQRDWDEWNLSYRNGELDAFMQRQLQVAIDVASGLQSDGCRILDVGCGVGWLAHHLSRFGQTMGVDISPASIELGQSKYGSDENLTLLCAQFETADLGPDASYDLIVSADSLAHVPDQKLFLLKAGRLLKPGGVLLLMTQNPFVWNRKRNVMPTEGRLRKWIGTREIKRLLPSELLIDRTGSIVPGGDKGILRWVESRKARALGNALSGGRWDSLLEKAGLGRELVVVCRKSSASQP